MKKIVLAVAAVFAIASPALAQAVDPEIGSGNTVVAQGPTVYQGAEGAFARVVPGPSQRTPRAALRTPNIVQDEYGNVIGADPDPNIRLQLLRDGESIQGF